jgi:hypothetical protein
MKRGDLVKVHSRTDGDIDGRLGLLVDFVDENLRSGRMCYAKVMFENGSACYLSPESVEVISEAR